MKGRTTLGVLLTGGVIAGLGLMMLPRRRRGFSLSALRLFFTRRNLNRWGKMIMRSATRLAPIMK